MMTKSFSDSPNAVANIGTPGSFLPFLCGGIQSGPKVIKLFSYSTQLSTKFIGILTFISMINTTPDRLKPRNVFICRYFNFYEQLKFRALLS